MSIKTSLIIFSMSLFLSATAAGQSAVDDSDVVGWSDITIGIPLIQADEGGKKVDKLH